MWREYFSDRVVLLTGAGSGMGRVEALALADAGAIVWVTDRDEEGAASVAAEIVAKGGDARAAMLDVTDADNWLEVEARVAEAHAGLDGLVNNAGVSFRAGIIDTALADWERVMSINSTGPFLGMKTCANLLSARPGSSVVNVSSAAGMVGYFAAAYGASKWALRGLTKTAALEFAGQGIRVNSVHPGLVDTPLLHSSPNSSSFVDSSLQAVPAGRTATPDEIASVVLFLLSPMSAYMTGSEVVVDGGLVAGGIYQQILRRQRELNNDQITQV
ncbi:oxidoreductase [Nocardia nova]|uniref:Oxidoreductase n=2 Tax=Nocardia nova TaxID=37330 RepID=A0A2S6ANA3_9NOCA|nr:oxidoreductase [Nocardia nova]PPJ36692.1 oxidoreductase [Nocardia nova]